MAKAIKLDYGLLKDDKIFVETSGDMLSYLLEIDKVLVECTELKNRQDSLDLSDRIEIDLFIMFAYNSLYWTHLRLQGVEVSEHPMKHEMLRIRETMLLFKQEKDKKLRPQVNVGVAKRFIKHSLWNLDQSSPKNKKIKFD